MRIAVHVPDIVAEELTSMATAEAVSVSSMVTRVMKAYLAEQKRKRLGRKVLEEAGTVTVDPQALDLLHQGRDDARS